jgi:hypothetical protein
VTTDLSEKIDISRIFIHPVNGSASSARVTSIEAANSVLERWAHDMPSQSAEYEVEILFEDGVRYYGHYHFDHQKKVSLRRDLRRRLTAMAAGGTHRVKHRNEAANDSIVSPQDDDSADCAQAVLNYYNI